MADYRLCDVCGCKAFYDSNLNYEYSTGNWDGKPIPEDEKAHWAGEVADIRLDYLGDWAVICRDCRAKGYQTAILAPKPQEVEP